MNTVSMDSLRGRFALRLGTVQDIDAVCAIDLEAGALFVAAGLDLSVPAEQEIARNDRGRWLHSLLCGKSVVAVGPDDETPVGFAALAALDDEPYLDQLSVLTPFMRRGMGTALLEAVEDMVRGSGGRMLWLTTYAHLSWNRPFYERKGFEVTPEEVWGPQMRAEVAYQRCWLPCPDNRVVMRKPLGAQPGPSFAAPVTFQEWVRRPAMRR